MTYILYLYNILIYYIYKIFKNQSQRFLKELNHLVNFEHHRIKFNINSPSTSFEHFTQLTTKLNEDGEYAKNWQRSGKVRRKFSSWESALFSADRARTAPRTSGYWMRIALRFWPRVWVRRRWSFTTQGFRMWSLEVSPNELWWWSIPNLPHNHLLHTYFFDLTDTLNFAHLQNWIRSSLCLSVWGPENKVNAEKNHLLIIYKFAELWQFLPESTMNHNFSSHAKIKKNINQDQMREVSFL